MRHPSGPAVRRETAARASEAACSETRHPPAGNIRPRGERTQARLPILDRRLLSAALAVTVVVIAGCKPTESVQWGYRGNSMIQLYNPDKFAKLNDLNAIPEPEPSDPYDPTMPMATEVHQNVQVLTDLNALEFARLMNAMTTWVAPEQGCEYCHNPENLAEDSKYTKHVARQMLTMTRDINVNWESHVVKTGVTCWTCHRGQAVPSDIWFTTPPPKTPSAKVTGWKGGQNVAGVEINGNAALPYDPLTPFLLQDTDVRVQGINALPYGNRQSIKQAEWTYSLMMYISKSLGVNCTYCHQTRAMGRWEESTPQRVTAWHGIRLVRSLNQDHLVPLKDLYPAQRLGPTGDAPKAACATCHKGSYKPLYGASMLDDYPSLRGVLPGRLSPDPTKGGAVSLAVAPEGVAVATMDERTSMAEAMAAGESVVADSEVAAPAPGVTAAEAADAARADASTSEDAEPVEAGEESAAGSDQPLAAAELSAAAAEPVVADENAALEPPAAAGEDVLADEPGADEVAQASTGDAESGAAAPVPAAGQLAGADESTTPSASEALAPPAQSTAPQPLLGGVAAPGAITAGAVAGAAAPRSVSDMTLAELDAMLNDLLEKLRAVRAELDAIRPAHGTSGAAPGGSPAPQQDAARDNALDANSAPEGAGPDDGPGETAKPSVPAGPPDASATDAATEEVSADAAALEAHARTLSVEIDELRAEIDKKAAMLDVAGNDAALEQAETQLMAMQARLEQETGALQQQLQVVRAQRDRAEERVAADLRQAHADAIDAAEGRLKAAQARLEQQRTALVQQLEVVREQRDKAQAEARSRISAGEHAAAIAAAERQITAIEARLDQQTHALGQQLDVVRAQREDARDEAAARVPAEEHFRTIAALESRIKAIQARLDQQVHALEQQLLVVRGQRDETRAAAADRIAALDREHAGSLAALEARIAAGDARQAQEREALRQQLEVVRGQRDAARAKAEAEIEQLNKRLADTEAQLRQLRGELNASEAAQAQAEDAAALARTLADTAAAVGGEVTDNGMVVNLGGDRLRFASGIATLPGGELPELDRTAQLLVARPELIARIEGHTDNVGSRDLNQSLAMQRAEAVMMALVERGVDASRITAVGVGPGRPIASNNTPGGRSQNRRVEIYVSERDQVADGSTAELQRDDQTAVPF